MIFIFICSIYRKQAWLWSLGDTHRTKDRQRYMSYFGMNSTMDTIGHSSHRYSIGDNNEVDHSFSNFYFSINEFLFRMRMKVK